MTNPTYNDTQTLSTELLQDILPENYSRHMRRELAAETVRAEMAKMEAAGRILQLTNEEINLLKSFRKFKTSIKKSGEVFKWQTALVEQTT
jgi:hypothetical protein